MKDEAPGIDVAEDVTARAIVGGELWGFTVAGAVVSKKGRTDIEPPGQLGRLRWRQQPKPKQPQARSSPTGGNDSDPLDEVSLPRLFGDEPYPSGDGNSSPPSDTDKSKKQQTGIGIAAAASVNLIKGTTQASVIDAGVVDAGSLSLTAENRANVVAATGGLAMTKEKSGGTAVALAGAFSYNGIDTTTTALAEDTDFVLDGSGIEWPTTGDMSEKNPTVRISSLSGPRSSPPPRAGPARSRPARTRAAVGPAVAAGRRGRGCRLGLGQHDHQRQLRRGPKRRLRDHERQLGGRRLERPRPDHGLRQVPDLRRRRRPVAFGRQRPAGRPTAVSAGVAVAVNKIDNTTTATLEDANVEWMGYSR